MASCYGNSNKEMPSDVQVVGNTKEQIKSRVKGRLTPANYTVKGVVQIHGASNVQLGHNVTVSQSTQKPLRPKDSATIDKESLQRLFETQKEVNAIQRNAVSQNVGSDWRYLGKELAGFSNAQMDQFEESLRANKYPFDEMIYQMLLKWEECSVDEPTIGTLARALHKCGMYAALQELVNLEKSP